MAEKLLASGLDPANSLFFSIAMIARTKAGEDAITASKAKTGIELWQD
jgi:hypothetical protein